jgi:hypothetical protein
MINRFAHKKVNMLVLELLQTSSTKVCLLLKNILKDILRVLLMVHEREKKKLMKFVKLSHVMTRLEHKTLIKLVVPHRRQTHNDDTIGSCELNIIIIIGLNYRQFVSGCKAMPEENPLFPVWGGRTQWTSECWSLYSLC